MSIYNVEAIFHWGKLILDCMTSHGYKIRVYELLLDGFTSYLKIRSMEHVSLTA